MERCRVVCPSGARRGFGASYRSMSPASHASAAPPTRTPPVPPLGVLLLAVLGISFAAPLVRVSDAHPLAIATWRLAISLAIVAVALVLDGSWRQLRAVARRDLLVAVGAGTMLALHFWSWNSSLGLTTIAASVVLVNLQPAFVVAGSALWLGESPSVRQATGIALAMVGAIVVALGDVGTAAAPGRNPLLGDALALVGAVTAAMYYLAGRSLRARLDLWPYVALVYGACLVVLVALSLALAVPLWPQPEREWLIFSALAVGPMLLGHTGMNWALRYLPAYVVNLTVLGEPVGATLLAWLLPSIREVPAPATLWGGALVLAGALAATWKAAAPRDGSAGGEG